MNPEYEKRGLDQVTYRGYWIVCRNCWFPIRLPSLLKASLRLRNMGSINILLACPACAYVEQYRARECKAVAFRIPDPFREAKATLYVVEVPCGISRCNRAARIYAVGAKTLSVASLLELWKHWVFHAPCRDHVLKPRRPWTWGVYSIPQPDSRMFDRN
jgi:hypothetical protein